MQKKSLQKSIEKLKNKYHKDVIILLEKSGAIPWPIKKEAEKWDLMQFYEGE